MKRYIIALLIISYSIIAFGDKPKILASNNAIAGIVEMVVGSEFEVDAIEIVNGCPHHYQAKPSDKIKLAGSDIVIYIDDNFDGFFVKLLKDYRGQIIKISQLGNLDFNGTQGTNWHFWLSLDNVKNLMEKISEFIIAKYPDKAEIIKDNLHAADKELNLLKQEILPLTKLNNIILLTNSAEHFFKGNNINYQALYKSDYSSLMYAKELNELLSNKTNNCFIIAPNQVKIIDIANNKRVAQINAENWHKSQNLSYKLLFLQQYKKIIDDLALCRR